MGVNYLPFARRQDVSLAAAGTRPSRAFTSFMRMATAGTKRVHLQDAIVFRGDDDNDPNANIPEIRMRIGIYGRNYFTEDFYHLEVYRTGAQPLCTVWNWEKPFRIYPGQRMRAQVGPSPWTGPPVRSVMFNGVRDVDDEPILLYAVDEVANTVTTNTVLEGRDMACPGDSSVRLYSITVPEYRLGQTNARSIYVVDPTGRPFWPDGTWQNIVDPHVCPILLGPKWVVKPDETITFEFENDTASQTETVSVIIRGCLEVEDASQP
jgi:hypothetical protein